LTALRSSEGWSWQVTGNIINWQGAVKLTYNAHLGQVERSMPGSRYIGNVRQRKFASATCSTTPSGKYAPLPRTDRLLSCDEFLHVIAVG
jgi:hypothetical protein